MANKHGFGNKTALMRQELDIGHTTGQHGPGNSSSQNRQDESQGRVLTGRTESSKGFVPSERLLRDYSPMKGAITDWLLTACSPKRRMFKAALWSLFRVMLQQGQ